MNKTEIINNEEENVIYPLPQALKEKAVDYLKKELHPDTLKEIREIQHKEGDSWCSGYHLFFGMGIRNLLRDVIKDDELPKNIWNGKEGMQNWDDYYVLVLEIAAGVKPIEAN